MRTWRGGFASSARRSRTSRRGRVQEFRERHEPDKLVLVAELDGEIVGAGLAGLSDVQGRGFVNPRVHPDARRRGVGTAMLHRLTQHVAGLGFDKAWASVDDPGSRAFAERFGFEEVDREVEQVIALPAELPEAPMPEGVEVVSIAYRPELLRETYSLAQDEGYADLAIDGDVVVTLDDWLHDEATLARRLVRRARRRPDRRLLRLGATRQLWRRRGRPDRGRARLAPARARDGAQAARARLGGGARLHRGRHVDAARQRGHARGQRASRLRVPRRSAHDDGPGAAREPLG